MLKEDVIDILEQHKGNVVTGGRLAGALGVSRSAVWKAVHLLRDEGHDIESIPNKGYSLSTADDTLNENTIRKNLNTSFVGQKMIVLPTVHSTNQYLKELDAETTDNGFVVIADGQTNGRGRRGRAFASPKGEGIYLSVHLKLEGTRQDVRFVTICAAVAVSKAIEHTCGIDADIKWVNDIFYNGKKVCGILTEAVLSGELGELNVLLGIGVNTGIVPPGLGDIATSVWEATGMRGIRNRLVAEVLNQFEAAYLDCIARDRWRDVVAHYRSKLFILGKRVLVTDMARQYEAIVQDVDDAGALVVKDDAGNVRHVASGEILLKW